MSKLQEGIKKLYLNTFSFSLLCSYTPQIRHASFSKYFYFNQMIKDSVVWPIYTQHGTLIGK